MKIVTNYFKHVSFDSVLEFENVILNDNPKIKRTTIFLDFKIKLLISIFKFFRILRINIVPNVCFLFKNNPHNDPNHLFTIMMSLDLYSLRPYLIGSIHNKSIFLFDAWPKDYQKIKSFCEEFHINYLFISSKQSSVYLDKVINNTLVRWIPEGIDFKLYKYQEYNKKDISILALGRRYDFYHNLIVEDLLANNVKYLYEKIKGELIFPTREEFIEGLSKTKISICVPSNITHPERAGDVETMTIRYLQSIVSKCLIVGHAPAEMIELFGYNPVIEINMDKPFEQLLEILNNFESYIPFIEQNYKVVIDNHTWSNRWEQMKNIWNKQVY